MAAHDEIMYFVLAEPTDANDEGDSKKQADRLALSAAATAEARPAKNNVAVSFMIERLLVFSLRIE